MFGPIMVVWFVVDRDCRRCCISATIRRVLLAINPYLRRATSSIDHGTIGLVTLGAVFLVVTGGEALYADLGHFGRKPIQTAWLGLVLPALLINYFGQGAQGARRSGGDRKSVLSAGAGTVPVADGRAGDGGDRDRKPGGDHRRLFAGASGDPARPAAAAGDPAHLGLACRPDLHSARHCRAADRRAAAGRAVPHVERARLGLRHRGRHHHGGRRTAGVHRDLEAMAVAAVADRCC